MRQRRQPGPAAGPARELRRLEVGAQLGLGQVADHEQPRRLRLEPGLRERLAVIERQLRERRLGDHRAERVPGAVEHRAADPRGDRRRAALGLLDALDPALDHAVEVRLAEPRRAQRLDELRERRLQVLAQARQRQADRVLAGVAADVRRGVGQALGIGDLVELLGALGQHRHAHARQALLAARIDRRAAVEVEVHRDQRQRVLLDQIDLDAAGQRERLDRRQPERPRRTRRRLVRAELLFGKHQLLRRRGLGHVRGRIGHRLLRRGGRGRDGRRGGG